MILVLAGTKDGRDLVNLLINSDYKVMASVFSAYGREMIDLGVPVHTGPLDANGFTTLIHTNKITMIVDASHPYAVNVSENAMKACQTTETAYVRYERPRAALPNYDGLHIVHDYAEAAQVAGALGKTIFLTTGSRHLKVFKSAAFLQNHRLIARVLPEPGVLAECLELGFTPRDIVAIQGPFSHQLNVALFEEYRAEVIVTKNSGEIGGSDTKITAAMDLHLPLVVIDRPIIQYNNVVYDVTEVIKFIREVY